MNSETITRDSEQHRKDRHVRSVRRGMARKAAAGFLVGPPKLGYDLVRTDDGSIARLDPELGPKIAGAFEMAAGGSSLREVAAFLRQSGVTGKRGGPVGLSTVQRMLADPYYAGEIRIAEGKLVQGAHEAAVPKGLFRRAQRQIRLRRCS